MTVYFNFFTHYYPPFCGLKIFFRYARFYNLAFFIFENSLKGTHTCTFDPLVGILKTEPCLLF